jgi:hypothetical protein
MVGAIDGTDVAVTVGVCVMLRVRVGLCAEIAPA